MQRSMIGVAFLACCVPMLGCSDSVTFSELVDFGPVGSAVWLEVEEDYGAWTGTHHELVLSPSSGLSTAYEDGYAAYNDQIRTTSESFSGEVKCEAWQGAYATLGDHLGPYMDEGAVLVTLSFHSMSEYGFQPQTASYSMSSDGDEWADLTVALFTDSYYDRIQEAFYVDDGVCRGWDMLDSSGNRAFDRYQAYKGTATVSLPAAEKFHVDFDGRLKFWGAGEPAGEVEGRFTAQHLAVRADFPEGVAWDDF